MKVKKGFTLIEIMIAILIIGIVAGIILVMIGNSTQKANQARFKSYVSGIKTALSMACSGSSDIVNINETTANFTLNTSIAQLDAGNSLDNYDCVNDFGIAFVPGSSLEDVVPDSCKSALARIIGTDFTNCP